MFTAALQKLKRWSELGFKVLRTGNAWLNYILALKNQKCILINKKWPTIILCNKNMNIFVQTCDSNKESITVIHSLCFIKVIPHSLSFLLKMWAFWFQLSFKAAIVPSVVLQMLLVWLLSLKSTFSGCDATSCPLKTQEKNARIPRTGSNNWTVLSLACRCSEVMGLDKWLVIRALIIVMPVKNQELLLWLHSCEVLEAWSNNLCHFYFSLFWITFWSWFAGFCKALVSFWFWCPPFY